jgi:hypothetical protein
MLRERFTPYGEPSQEPTFQELEARGPYPEEPLLNMDEIEEVIDQTHLIRDPLTIDQLSPYETVVRVRDVDLPKASSPPSNLRTFMRLTGANKHTEIGDYGPAIAALGGEDESDAAQNRFVAPHIRDSILQAILRVRRLNQAGETERRLRFPKLMRATLIHTAEEGGIVDEEFDPHRPFRQEKPGKAMLVNFGTETPGGRKFSRYAGWGFPIFVSVDAAPLFIRETVNYVNEEEPDFLTASYTARDGKEHPTGQFFDLAVERLLTDLSESKDGFLEFKNLDPRNDMGMLNQSWADSAGAYTHKNGEPANHSAGIAAVEVQGYVYDSLIGAAQMYREKFGEPDKAEALEKRAKKLQRDFLDRFFVTDERGTYAAMGRDYDEQGNPRNLEVRHINRGLLLESGILEGNNPEIVTKREAIIQTIFSPSMITKYGFNTLDREEVAHRPGGDHLGQIWPHVNEAARRGLAKHGYFGLAYYLAYANWLIYNESCATPEYIRGDSFEAVLDNPQMIVVLNQRLSQRPYMFEIPGQRLQGWSNAAVLAAKYDYSGIPGTKQYARRLPTEALDPRLREFEKSILESLPSQDGQ